MKPIKGPRAGSRAHSVLVYLQAAKGEAAPAVLARVVAWLGSPRTFDEDVIGPLARDGFVSKRAAVIVLSERGSLFLNPPAPQDPESIVLVTGRYVPPQRPLSTHNRPRIASMRPGALDYRDIPSVYASQRIPYKSSLAAEDGNGGCA